MVMAVSLVEKEMVCMRRKMTRTRKTESCVTSANPLAGPVAWDVFLVAVEGGFAPLVQMETYMDLPPDKSCHDLLLIYLSFSYANLLHQIYANHPNLT